MEKSCPIPHRLLVSALVSLGLPLLLTAGAPESPSPRLNLLLITIDTLRADRVGFYSGLHVSTPQIDSLASRGVVFTRAFSHCTTTLPSHTNILLGTTPSYHGVHDNVNFVVRGDFLTLAEHLKSFGYSTAAFIGGFPLESRFGLNQGFDTYDDRLDRTGPTPSDSGTRRAEAVFASAMTWLKAQKAPWFIWIHLWDPHDPYSPPEPYRTQYAAHPYDGEVAYVDAAIGGFFKFMKERGLGESSLIVLTGDHGESLGEHGEKTHGLLAYNATLWIPLIIASPGFDHRVVPSPVSHVDIFPTVCDLLGVAKPDFLQGTSLVRAMRGGKAGSGPIYFESLSSYYNMNWAPISGFIQDDVKYIDSPVPEIYDLGKDFDEKSNLAETGAATAKKKKLKDLVLAQSSAKAAEAGRESDRETIEKLRSLGYMAGFRASQKTGPESFRQDDDAKALLPFYNKSMHALDLYQAGKTREAIEEAREVIRARANISTAYLNLAHFYKEEGRIADAVLVLKSGREALPGNYYIFLEYVTCLYEAGDFDEAIRAFVGGPPQVELDPLGWNYAGLAWLKKGDEGKARACFEKALDIDGDSSVTWYNLGNLHYFAFEKTKDRSRLKQAAACEQKAVAIDPANGSAFYVLGVILFQDEDYPGAAGNLEKALALDPGLDNALYYLGLASVRKGDIPKACSYFKRFKKTSGFDLLPAKEKGIITDIISRCSRQD
jgi:arylsulfatase A-like enzyme/Tfp pilus assembly protein PilF